MSKRRFSLAGVCFAVASLIEAVLAITNNEWPAAIVAGIYLITATAFFVRAHRNKLQADVSGPEHLSNCRVRR